MTPSELAIALTAAIFIDFDVEAAEQILDPNYIQHNVGVPTGAAPILGFIPGLKDSGIGVETHRVLSQGDLVVMHNTYTNAQAFGADVLVGFDVYRVEGDKIVEHWDNLQPIVTETASGRSMTDGPTEVIDQDLTAANKAVVESFINDILLGGQMEKVTDYVSTTDYAQHNPGAADGLDGLGAAMAAMAEAGQAMTYANVHMVVADGNFVFAASEGTIGETPTAFFDLFRIEDGLIVEHWDTISTIPDDMPHDNGKF